MTPIELPQPPQRILIVKPSAIGDVVHTLPVLNLLRGKWPEAQVSWLVTPACQGLLDRHPMLHETIPFERLRLGTGWRDPKAAAGIFRLGRELRDRAFDLVIDLQGLFRSGWLTGQTKAPVRVGFANAREFAWHFYTHHVPVQTMEQHAIDRYLTICQALGCGREPVEFPFATDDADRRHIAQLIDPSQRYAVLMPGTNWPTKRWPAERFAELVRPLRERFGLTTVTAGGPDAQDLANRISADLNLVGKTNLRQLVALLERADVVIANDSGPMHIAAALRRPLVTPYGPTNPVRTGPYRRPDSVIRLDIPCSPCYSRTCSHQSCLQWLGSGSVLELVSVQMGRSNEKTHA